MKRNMMIIVGYVLFFIFAQAKSSQTQYFAAEQLISKYGDQNWEYRRQNIQQNRYIINRINSDPNQTYTLAQNSFIIWSQEQFQRNYLRLIPSKPHSIKFAKILSELNTQQVRKSSINKKMIDKAQNVMSIKSLMKRTSDVSNQFLQKYLKFSKMANSNITQELKIKNSSDPIQLIKSYEQKTLAQVRQYLSNKGIFYADDQEAVIQKFRLKSDLQNLSQEQLLSILSKIEKQYEQNQIYQSQFRNEQSLKENKKTRLLQQVQTPSDQQFIEKQIKDVDWSCLSGDVRRQGLCGACYALAVADNIAAMMGIYFFGYHINLSGQDIIYCGDKSLTFGCQGGFIEGAFLYALQNGLLDGYNYPYILQNGWAKPAEKCSQIKKRTPLFKVQGFLEVYQNNFSCKKMMFALQYHPITVGITGFTLTFYKGGVFQCVKEDQQMNHAALLVGYKKGKGWKIKNSWGQGWGQGGYFWLKPGNTCRVCQFGFYPMIDKDLGLQQFKSKTMYATCPLS